MAEGTENGEVDLQQGPRNLFFSNREHVLNESDDNLKEQSSMGQQNANNISSFAEDIDSPEESSHSEYEFSLREENIRLKSRLEQAKEKALDLERQLVKNRDELKKEKNFSEKANKTIYKLVSEKNILEDQLKRQPKSNKELEDIIRKLKHEIYQLEESLERQRKRYHHEHLLIYDDLKNERRKQFEWKQTYLRSQVSVMAFRKKLQLLRMNLRPEDHDELMRCLEIGLHDDCDSDNESSDNNRVSEKTQSGSVIATEIRKTYEHERPRTSHETSRNYDKYRSYNESSHRDSRSSHYERESHYPSTHSSHEKRYQNGDQSSENRSRITSPELTDHQPKVFIVEERNRYGASNTNLPVDTPHEYTSSREIDHRSRVSSPPTASYYRNSTKPWADRASRDLAPNDHSTTHYKHWHHYSADSLGGQYSVPQLHRVKEENREKNTPSVARMHADNNGDDFMETNVNESRYLELKFDEGVLKKGTGSMSHDINKPINRMPETGITRSVYRSVPVGTPLDQKKLWCLTCDGEVTKKVCGHSNLVIQEREKEFPCPTCNRIFNNRSHLKRHNMIHSGEKPWACTYCEKRFNRKSHLSRHILTHTGERPFKCPYCAKGFADNSDLKRHKQIHESTPGFVPIRPKETPPTNSTHVVASSIESGSHVAVTNVTSLSVISSSGMTSSVNLYTNTNPTDNANKKKAEAKFPCTKCGKHFTRKSHLTRHKQTHEQVKIFCDCGRMFRQNAHLHAHLPACRRKREAVEAKYLAEHPREDTLIKLEMDSPLDQVVHSPVDDAGQADSMEFDQERPGSTVSIEMNYDGSQHVPSLSNATTNYETENALSGIPPLIRDPV